MTRGRKPVSIGYCLFPCVESQVLDTECEKVYYRMQKMQLINNH